MKNFSYGLACGIFIGVTALALGDEAFYKGKVAFVKVTQENLRGAASANGQILGTLAKGAPMQILAVQDKWLQVAAVGYIWKESVTGDEKSVRGEQSYRAAMILVKTEAEAQEIVKAVQSGADFQKLASEKSLSLTKAKGGDLGEAYPGDFSKEFEDAILPLKVGDISSIIKTQHGYHLFKRLK